MLALTAWHFMILVAQEAGPFLLTLFYSVLLTMKHSLNKYIVYGWLTTRWQEPVKRH